MKSPLCLKILYFLLFVSFFIFFYFYLKLHILLLIDTCYLIHFHLIYHAFFEYQNLKNLRHHYIQIFQKQQMKNFLKVQNYQAIYFLIFFIFLIFLKCFLFNLILSLKKTAVMIRLKVIFLFMISQENLKKSLKYLIIQNQRNFICFVLWFIFLFEVLLYQDIQLALL